MASAQHGADLYVFCFPIKVSVMALFLLYRDILRGHYSNIPRTFSTDEPSKGPKRYLEYA